MDKGYEIHLRNLEAESEYNERKERDAALYEEVTECDDEISITSYNYSKPKIY
jgi:hypothetical protein